MKKNKIVLFFPSIGNISQPIIPFAFLYLEKSVRDLAVEIVIIDENIGDTYHDYIQHNLQDILFVGVSAIIGIQIERCVLFSTYVKSLSTIPVLWGGWYPTTLPEQVLKEDYIDFIITGQGEIPFRAFTEKMMRRESCEAIPGLGFRKNNIITLNAREPISVHPEFHRVNLSFIDVNRYLSNSNTYCYPATIGCNMKCTFCTTGSVYNHLWFHKDIDQIISDIRYFKEHSPGFNNLSIEDDNFFADRNFVIDFAKALIANHFPITWAASGHARTILSQFSDEDMQLIKISGCEGIYIGAESGDNQILELLNKKTTIEDNLNFVKFLTKHKITPSFSLMAFIPGNIRKELRLSALLITKAHLINPSFFATINYYTPCPNTALYEIAQKHGFTFPENNEALIHSLKNKMYLPWIRKKDENWIILIKYFYYRFSDPQYYKKAGSNKTINFILNKIFYFIIRFRVLIGKFDYPLEAILYLFLLKLTRKEDYYKHMFDISSNIRKVVIE